MSRSITLAIVTASIIGLYTLGRAQEPSQISQSGSAVGMNVDQLRNEVMSSLPGRIARQMDGLLADHELPAYVAQSACQIWGIEVMPVPEIFSGAHESLAEGHGLLIVRVAPDSPANLAGLRSGMVLLTIEEQPLLVETDLPLLEEVCRVHVLTKLGVRVATIQAVVTPIDDFLGHVTADTGGENVSVSNVNGQVCIKATLMTKEGLKSVELRGSRVEIDQQIAQLPAELAAKVRRSVGY